jgi:glycosyltransferase EpsE
MNSPVVSVIMATYNDKPSLLKIAIDSILSQTFTDWEFIIVDDSTEIETIELIDAYKNNDSRLIVIRDDKKIGFVPALNIGLRTAQGSFIARMDGDDISHPERFEKQINFLNNNNKYAVVGSDINLINSVGAITSKLEFPEKGIQFRLFAMLRCPIQHGAIMMRRSIVDSGIYYDEGFKRSEDLELWLRLLKKDIKLYNIKETLYDFRIDDDYASKRSKVHFQYNLNARLKNFTWKYPITGIVGILISFMYMNTPLFIKRIIYSKLNNKSA